MPHCLLYSRSSGVTQPPMGDNMAQVSWKVWKINMVETIQANRTGALMTLYLKARPMKK